MSVFFKFAASTEVNTVAFDGVHISVGDLKQAIIEQKRLGRGTEFQLIVTNSQTDEEYSSDSVLIPKNSSLIVKRIPVENGAPVKKFWDPNAPRTNVDPALVSTLIPAVSESVKAAAPAVAAFSGTDLTKLGGSEEDKIKSMMNQSTSQYDPSTFVRYRNQHLAAPAPRDHKCYRCFNLGHYAQQCPLVAADVKKATGIPRSFMMTVADPKTPGAMLAPDGTLAVPKLDYLTYTDKERGRMSAMEQQQLLSSRPSLPANLRCTLCSQLMRDAVTSPCCGENFCDECFRCALIESDSSQCPHCGQTDGSTDNIIPNRFVRKRVVKFQKEMDEWEAKYAANVPVTAEPPPPMGTVQEASSSPMTVLSSAPGSEDLTGSVTPAPGSIRVKSSSLLFEPSVENPPASLQQHLFQPSAGGGVGSLPAPAVAPSSVASESVLTVPLAQSSAAPLDSTSAALPDSASADTDDKLSDADKLSATVATSIKTGSSDTISDTSAIKHDSIVAAVDATAAKQEVSKPGSVDLQTPLDTDTNHTTSNNHNSSSVQPQNEQVSVSAANVAVGGSPRRSHHPRAAVPAGNLCRLVVPRVHQGHSGHIALVSLR